MNRDPSFQTSACICNHDLRKNQIEAQMEAVLREIQRNFRDVRYDKKWPEATKEMMMSQSKQIQWLMTSLERAACDASHVISGK